ncbi:MAG: hypothetical protein BMS9Abin13_378 [Patescibacteria group bacterium]|nr:MAG: hypothetical protein BMS9Abin13_378 [Patescibacteria group bacterium]
MFNLFKSKSKEEPKAESGAPGIEVEESEFDEKITVEGGVGEQKVTIEEGSEEQTERNAETV